MDTNHVTAWEAQKPALIGRLNSLPKNTLIFTPAVTLGEISAGHEMTSGDLQRRHSVKQFLILNVIPYAVSISHYTAPYYGQIIGRIWKQNPPPNPSISVDRRLVDLGVDVNDVWIVACAWEHGLTLLTTDNMAVVRRVTPDVTFENWLI